MIDSRPGLNPQRLARLMRAAVARLRLDLRGLSVLTEAASGAYAVTPVLAALAGAERVDALTRDTRYGSAEQVAAQTLALAALAGAPGRIRIHTARSPALLAGADIITNSGHVRPLDAAAAAHVRPGVAVPLMYEAWEYRPTDLDLGALKARGALVAGTNERHPAVGVFDYLGAMAVKLLHDAGVATYGCRVLSLCDNDFAPFIAAGLRGAGAAVAEAPGLAPHLLDPAPDAVLVALRPRGGPLLGAAEAGLLAERAPGAVLAQYWGDVDRAALRAAGVPAWPPEPPAAGHMGVLPSAVGPEPIVRLQAGGLKVGELLARGLGAADADDLALVQPM